MIKPSTLNALFLITGLVGLAVCLHYWNKDHHNPWLIGVGVFVYFLISSFSEVLSNLRKR
jgi:hypothetical protein